MRSVRIDPLPFGFRFSKLFFSPGGTAFLFRVSTRVDMATRRSNSWFAFLCEGSTSTLPSGTEVPASMLQQFPEEVRDTRIFRVSEMHPRIICPRILESNNCDRPANCPNLHPDFIAERRVVPDLICHQWFQAVCGFGDRCWHQHGDTIDSAMRLSVQTQTSPRRECSPFLYDPQNGGTIRQINREEAARMISTSLAQFRLNTIRSGTSEQTGQPTMTTRVLPDLIWLNRSGPMRTPDGTPTCFTDRSGSWNISSPSTFPATFSPWLFLDESAVPDSDKVILPTGETSDSHAG